MIKFGILQAFTRERKLERKKCHQDIKDFIKFIQKKQYEQDTIITLLKSKTRKWVR